MFKYVGKQLKVVAIVLFVIEVIASIILAFVLGIHEEWHYETEYVLNHAIFWPLLIGGPIAAYISNLLLYGFGVIVDMKDMGY